MSLSDDNLMRAIGNFDESFAGNVGNKFFGPDTLPLNMAVIVKDWLLDSDYSKIRVIIDFLLT